jgi:uncharacterized protein YecE (DUF72 family)
VIRVGVAGWSYADWKGRVYPRSSVGDFHPLPYLARYFDCIEINSSFYALPRIEYVTNWVEFVRDKRDFRFCIKLHRDFTHGEVTEQDALQFRRTFEPMVDAGKLGVALAQFHQGFENDAAGRSRLARVQRLAGNLPLVVELRHRSWFYADALRYLEETGVNLAHIDMPASPDVVPQVRERDDLPYFLGPTGYLRVHGRNDADWYDPDKDRDDKYNWLYKEEDSALFARYAQRLANVGGDTYVITNNHFAGKAAVNGIEIQFALAGDLVSAPPELVATYPSLRKITKREGQGQLF